MNRFLLLGLFFISLLFSGDLFGQSSKCASMHLHQKNLEKYPELKEQMIRNDEETRKWLESHHSLFLSQRAIIKIPVVVHIIWHDPVENVSDQQVYSQIDVLNADYRLQNKDALPSSHPFHKFMGDAGIEFCLAQLDPEGKATNGITRTQTSVKIWTENILQDIKSTAKGGRDNWSPDKYLNIYVVNLQGETLGFASFPDELVKMPKQDGVVIRYEAFGTLGTAGNGIFKNSNKGRTATHEVGHWLNLLHIWGDEMCGDDKVADTPPAEDENNLCPRFPQRPNNRCGSDANGEMYMNFMDYVEDSCMALFTLGQTGRMLAAINMFRPALLNSTACVVADNRDVGRSAHDISIIPNPNKGFFICKLTESTPSDCTIQIYNAIGELVKSVYAPSSDQIDIDCSELSTGIYYLCLRSGSKSFDQKMVLIQ